MPRVIPVFVASIAVVAGCAQSRYEAQESTPPTVLKVENQGIPGTLDIFVYPEHRGAIRLGSVNGMSAVYFTLPSYLLHGTQRLQFEVLPIAKTSGRITQSILVVPGDTVVLKVPGEGISSS